MKKSPNWLKKQTLYYKPMSINSDLSAVLLKHFQKNFAPELVEKFDLDEDEVKEFIKSYFISHMKKGGKGTKGEKGTNGKGRISGYILFSNEHRAKVKDENPDIQFKDVGRRLGEMWRKLSDTERAKWAKKATDQNTKNGLPTPAPKTPAPKTTKTTKKPRKN